MSSPDVERLVEEWLTLAETGERLGIPLGKVKQLVRDGELLAVPRGDRGTPHVPAATLVDGGIVRGLAGTLTLLRDAGYDEEESARWLFTAEDRLDEAPIQALASGRIKAVRRVAQTLGF